MTSKTFSNLKRFTKYSSVQISNATLLAVNINTPQSKTGGNYT